MIAPFQFRKFNQRILITNDLGRYMFLSPEEFELYINDRLTPGTDLYEHLKEDRFLYDSSREKFLEDTKYELRLGKSYLFSATSLHIFVVTNFCNARCVYCQAQSRNIHKSKEMSEEVAKKAVDIALQSPQKSLSFEFQGGEPLSNFTIIKYIVLYAEANKKDRDIQYTIVSNLSLLTEDIISFIKEYNITISTSLDGNQIVHEYNRPLVQKRSSFEVVEEKIRELKDNGIPCGAIQTTTQMSLDYHKEIVDEYVKMGFDSIFIRPLTPLGNAKTNWDVIGYTTEEFVEFYTKCIRYILELNKSGIRIKEGHASVFLTKILDNYGTNYMELRSPCGASVGQMAYYYDGNIFTCDEGRMLYEMGDSAFRLGDVFHNDYNDLIDSKLCKAVCKYSILECLPKCSDCVFQPYCGTCPVVNYAYERDIVEKYNKSYRCEIFKGMLETLFSMLENDDNESLLREWTE